MNNGFYDFMRRVEDYILNSLPEGAWQIKEHTVRKNNVLLHGVSVIKEGDAVGPVIFMEECFEDYKKGTDFESICKRIVASLKEAEARMSACPIDPGSILRHDTEKFIMQLVDTGKNREFLKGVPHTEFMNLSVVYRIDLPEEEATILVTNELAEKLGLKKTELFERACKYTAKTYPIKIASVGSVLDGIIPGPFESEDIDEQVTMLVITNDRSLYGASALMDVAALKQVSDIIGGDFYILPSSVHEVLAVPASGADEKYLLEMVRMINRTELEKTDVLSDSIYHYDRERGQLEEIKAEPERGADREEPLEHTM